MHAEWLDRFVWHSDGKGVLVFVSGQRLGVDWQLVQTRAGRLFVLVRGNGSTQLGHVDLETMLCFGAQPTQLLSQDDDEWATSVELREPADSVHPEAKVDGWLTISAGKAERARKDNAAVAYRFAISNIAMDHPPDAEWVHNGKKLTWCPVEEYPRAISTLRTLHRIAVTATLTIEIADHLEAARMADIACDLASYACGCRVQWVYQEGLNADGRPAWTFMPNPITGPYVGLPLIKEGSLWQFIQQQWDSYAAFRAGNLSQARRLLGLLLNATADDDFMELRGSKLATTIDAVVSMVIGADPEASQFRSRGSRSAFLKELRAFIARELPPHLVESISPETKENIAHDVGLRSGDILRLSFRNAIRQTCNKIRIAIDDADTKQFVRSRNELIHEARFLCQNPERPQDWPFTKTHEEYFWMLRFVDRVVLRTIGYRGPFLDRCTRDGSELPAEPD